MIAWMSSIPRSLTPAFAASALGPPTVLALAGLAPFGSLAAGLGAGVVAAGGGAPAGAAPMSLGADMPGSLADELAGVVDAVWLAPPHPANAAVPRRSVPKNRLADERVCMRATLRCFFAN